MSIQTPATTLNRIKRRAKIIARLEQIQHVYALDKAAQEAGFRNFNHARNVIEATIPASLPIMPTHYVTLSAYWRDYDVGVSGRETLRIPLKRPWTELIRKPQFDNGQGLYGFDLVDGSNHPEHLGNWQNISASGARRRVCAAARTLAFIDATGLRPSSAFRRAFPSDYFEYGIRIPGQDHATVWFDPSNRRYLIANEPYEAAAESRRSRGEQEQQQWCEKYGYDTTKAPWLGMYNPDGGTHLYLFSHKNKGIALEPVIAALAQLAPPLVEADWTGGSTQNTFPPRVRRIVEPIEDGSI